MSEDQLTASPKSARRAAAAMAASEPATPEAPTFPIAEPEPEAVAEAALDAVEEALPALSEVVEAAAAPVEDAPAPIVDEAVEEPAAAVEAAISTLVAAPARLPILSTLTSGVGDISRTWLDAAHFGIRTHYEGLGRLADCRTASDFIEARGDIVRRDIEALTQGGELIAKASRQAAHDFGAALKGAAA